MKKLGFEESTAGSTSQRAGGGQVQTSLQRHASSLANFTEHLTGWEMGKSEETTDFIPLTTGATLYTVTLPLRALVFPLVKQCERVLCW